VFLFLKLLFILQQRSSRSDTEEEEGM
jgi:hypothetical protein